MFLSRLCISVIVTWCLVAAQPPGSSFRGALAKQGRGSRTTRRDDAAWDPKGCPHGKSHRRWTGGSGSAQVWGIGVNDWRGVMGCDGKLAGLAHIGWMELHLGGTMDRDRYAKNDGVQSFTVVCPLISWSWVGFYGFLRLKWPSKTSFQNWWEVLLERPMRVKNRGKSWLMVHQVHHSLLNFPMFDGEIRDASPILNG
jgi:hypothetical protein